MDLGTLIRKETSNWGQKKRLEIGVPSLTADATVPKEPSPSPKAAHGTTFFADTELCGRQTSANGSIKSNKKAETIYVFLISIAYSSKYYLVILIQYFETETRDTHTKMLKWQ